MKVLVTGGTGSVGGPVVDELLARGHEVTVIGRSADQEIEGAAYEVCDARDYERLLEVLEGHDSVIHLAAIPSPREDEDPLLFDINCRGTFNIYEACARHNIQKISVASSINALGQRFGVRPVPIRYFPIDEAHPALVTDAYSFSKQIVERIGQYAYDRYGISSVQIRIPAVLSAVGKRVDRLREAYGAKRFGHWAPDFWCLCDNRDSARAFVLGIEADYEGSHPLFVNDRVNCFGVPSRELAAEFYPEVVEWRAPMEEDEALICCRWAKDVIGWEPEFSWQGVAAGGPVP